LVDGGLNGLLENDLELLQVGTDQVEDHCLAGNITGGEHGGDFFQQVGGGRGQVVLEVLDLLMINVRVDEEWSDGSHELLGIGKEGGQHEFELRQTLRASVANAEQTRKSVVKLHGDEAGSSGSNFVKKWHNNGLKHKVQTHLSPAANQLRKKLAKFYLQKVSRARDNVFQEGIQDILHKKIQAKASLAKKLCISGNKDAKQDHNCYLHILLF